MTEDVVISCSGWQQWFAPGEEVTEDVTFDYMFYYRFEDDEEYANTVLLKIHVIADILQMQQSRFPQLLFQRCAADFYAQQ